MHLETGGGHTGVSHEQMGEVDVLQAIKVMHMPAM
jgi:hypothetical protein